jgi:coenzyme F420 hydrogenase subunit beta
MKHPTSLQEVVASGLCTGCGLCASVAGAGEIRMGISDSGFARPRFAPAGHAGASPQILTACPGATLSGPERRDPIPHHPVWGPVAALHRTWAADPAVRRLAAAGGTLTALAQYLLDKDEVDAVLHVRANQNDPMLDDAVVSRSSEDVLSAAKSRYGPAAPLVRVAQLLDEGLRFAVVAKPCDISAMRNLATVDDRVGARVPYLLTLFCGGVSSVQTAEKIAAHHGVARADVTRFQWRGDGWPGPTRVVNTAGVVFDMSYDEAWSPKHPWTQPHDLQWRCKVCPDAIGETADISAPDGWLMREGRPVHEEADGVNVTVVRTAAGERLLRGAVEAGYVVTAPMSFGELDQMHYDHLPRKLSHPARRFGMALMREPTTRVSGYRSGTAVRRAGLRRTAQALLGTIRRVRDGRNRENVDMLR